MGESEVEFRSHQLMTTGDVCATIVVGVYSSSIEVGIFGGTVQSEGSQLAWAKLGCFTKVTMLIRCIRSA